MANRSKTTETETDDRDPAGKPQSQIDAETPLEGEAADAAQAEYESRVPAVYYDLHPEEAASAETEEHESDQMARTDAGL